MSDIRPDRERFERLLRWYPKRWRALHGDVMLATLLDEADRTGRSVPSAAERRAAAVHGLAARLDVRLALTLGVVGLVGSLTGTVSWMSGYLSRDPSMILQLLLNGVVPAVVFVAVIALARGRALLNDGRALVLSVTAVVANILGALATMSWALGFEATDDGVPATGLAAAWTPLVGAGLILATVGLALFFHAVFERAGLRGAGSGALAAVVAIVSAPVLGYALMTPFSTVVLATIAIVVALTSMRGSSDAMESRATVEVAPVAAALRPVVFEIRVLAFVALVAGATGLAWAFTGSVWSPFGGDATRTMREGIAILCLSALPALAGVALLIKARSRLRARHTWGPAFLAATGFGVLAFDYVVGDGSGDSTLGMYGAAALVGVAVGWFGASRIRLGGWGAGAVGAAIAAAYTLSLGPIATPYLAFLVPIAAIALAFVAGHSSRLTPARQPAH